MRFEVQQKSTCLQILHRQDGFHFMKIPLLRRIIFFQCGKIIPAL